MNDQEKFFSKIPNSLPGLIPNYCDRCGSRYETHDLEMVKSDLNKALFKLACKRCGNTYMIQVQNPTEGLFAAKRMPFKTDITTAEFNKFATSKKIQSDEILDVYSSLESVNTIKDFDKLFTNSDSFRNGK